MIDYRTVGIEGAHRGTRFCRPEYGNQLTMTEAKNGPDLLDRPEILERLFFPRRASREELTSPYGLNHVIEAAPGISIGCRFYPAGARRPASSTSTATGR